MKKGSVWDVLRVSARLGVTSFGGPIAHLGYFHAEYVKRRKWIDEKSYADLVSLCQFLPGPASSQVGIAIGIERAGLWGGLAAWVGFTLPSAILLVLFALLLHGVDLEHAGWLHGLMLVAVAIVAQAVWSMARNLAADKQRGSLALISAIVTLVSPMAWTQVLLIVLAGVFGRLFIRAQTKPFQQMRVPISRKFGVTALVSFAVLLVGLPLARTVFPNQTLAMVDSFYRAGALVFGGGHVVLPLLQQAVVPTGWMTNGEFLAGYGATQAVPGPLFTFSAYLGAVMHSSPNGVIGAVIALLAIFLPAFLLVVGALPFWNVIRQRVGFQAALNGINAAVVGILIAALYNPVWTSAVHSAADFCLALVCFGLLMLWKLPPWVVVIVGVLGGMMIG